MNEAVETEQSAATDARRLPLAETHRKAGAAMRELEGWVVPAHYGDARGEYDAVRGGESAGLIDLSARGRVEVSGAEATQFLNGMLTNDVAKLEEGAWMEAAFPNAQGRLLASARIARLGEGFLFDTEPATSGRMWQSLERFTLAGDFRVRDLTCETAMLSVQGARAGKIVAAALGEETAQVERGRVSQASFRQATVRVMRATHTGEDGFDLTISVDEAPALWDALVAAGARPVGHEALEMLRVETGIPRYGVDATDANVVLEVVNEAEAVSYTKGCYVGQEIIARIHWRGHVAKRLAGLVLERDVEIPSGARVKTEDGEREAGRVTSSVYSPRLRARVALGLVKYDFLKPGTELKIFAGEEELCAARVAELPLVRGSWQAGRDMEPEG